MALFEGFQLTIKQKAQLNQPLPDVLSIYDIAELWSNDPDIQKLYLDRLETGFLLDWHDWEYKEMASPNREGMLFYGNQRYIDIFISYLQFRDWLISYDEELPKDCLLANWWKNKSFDQTNDSKGNSPSDKPNKKRRTRNEQRDEDFEKYLQEKGTDFDIHKLKKSEIQKELMAKNQSLWAFNFDGWCRHTKLYSGKQGRKKQPK